MPEETIISIRELGNVLYKIHTRLLNEGKIKIENGKIIFLENK